MKNPPTALTIAGSDNSAGAGIQADLKTFSSLDVYGLTALTCVVAEVPGKVTMIEPMTPQIVAEQIELSLNHFQVGAIKTGMLYSAEIAQIVSEMLQKHGAGIPLVVDPVMVATSGHRLLQEDAIEIYRSQLFPMARVITPNLDEAEVLIGEKICTVNEMIEAGKQLSTRFGAAFLMKGGHLRGEQAVDVLVEGDSIRTFEAPFIRGISTHGTGCTYSSAIAAGLSLGWELAEAVARAKVFLTLAIEHSLQWQTANGQTTALNHFPGMMDSGFGKNSS